MIHETAALHHAVLIAIVLFGCMAIAYTKGEKDAQAYLDKPNTESVTPEPEPEPKPKRKGRLGGPGDRPNGLNKKVIS